MIPLGQFLMQSLLVVLVGLPVASTTPSPEMVAAPAPVSEALVQTADEEGGVRFTNASRDLQFVLATFGGEKCEEMADRAQIEVEPGATETVDSGESRVCWCASTVGKVGNCGAWSKAKPGKRVTIR